MAKKKFVEQIYDGAADFGLFMSFIGLIIGTILGICLIGGGIYFWNKKNVFTANTIATVKSISCHDVTSTDAKNNQQTNNICDLTITYTVNNATMTNHINSNIQYSVNDTFNIFYNPDNVNQISEVISNWKLLGGILIGFGIVILGSAILQYYITRRFKFAAAAAGVGDGIGMITHAVQ